MPASEWQKGAIWLAKRFFLSRPASSSCFSSRLGTSSLVLSQVKRQRWKKKKTKTNDEVAADGIWRQRRDRGVACVWGCVCACECVSVSVCHLVLSPRALIYTCQGGSPTQREITRRFLQPSMAIVTTPRREGGGYFRACACPLLPSCLRLPLPFHLYSSFSVDRLFSLTSPSRK